MKRASPAGQQTLLNAVPVDSIANVNQVDGDHWLPCSPSDNPLQIMAESFQSSSNDRPTAFNDEDVPSHLTVAAYAYWILGMFGAHRFYLAKPVSGVIWLFTCGCLFVGWIVDFFLIPAMTEEAQQRYPTGRIDYTICWVLLTFLGVFGVHRFYLGKIITGVIYLCTGGLLGIGVIYDYLTLNEQISEVNLENQ